ncbi:LuxR family transcriptional regulator [Sinorhizobium sp. BJ1]|nr:LuxR family transcriptional regulator [Sinorhizobium sp. BJ1]
MLSPHEKSCLRWVSEDRSVAEIALIQGRCIPEVEQSLARALAALGAKSIDEALMKANLSTSK